MEDTREVVRCTGCQLKHYTDNFKVNRLGQRLKTCLQCNERDRVRRKGRVDKPCKPTMCEHGKQLRRCLPCGGGCVCSHGRRSDKPCRDCPADKREPNPNALLLDGPREAARLAGIEKRAVVAAAKRAAKPPKQVFLPQPPGLTPHDKSKALRETWGQTVDEATARHMIEHLGYV
jgi:hypothetical protein